MFPSIILGGGHIERSELGRRAFINFDLPF